MSRAPWDFETSTGAFTRASREADIVSSHIATILGERAFTLSPMELCDLHR